MTPVEPKLEFQHLSEDTVLAALADPTNPVAAEVARLIAGYTANFESHVERLGYIPSALLRIKARWPIEAVAMRLMTDTVRETIAGR